MSLKIVKDTNPRLREKCAEVPTPLSEEHQTLIDDMMDYLLKSQDPEYRKAHPSVREGVGLAAPQVGKQLRMLVINIPGDKPGEDISLQLVNPRIVRSSVKKVYLSGGEGCLSVDQDHPGYVLRDFKIAVEAYDAKAKKPVSFVARSYLAIVLQHEIDHLSGILYYDRISKTDPFSAPEDAVAL